MILGIGSDLIEVSRMEAAFARFGSRLIQRILSLSEQADFLKRKDKAIFLASRFAAKEAVAKALGTGFRDGISMRDISVVKGEGGRPEVAYSGIAAQYVKNLQISQTFLTLTHERKFALAFAVVESSGYNRELLAMD